MCDWMGARSLASFAYDISAALRAEDINALTRNPSSQRRRNMVGDNPLVTSVRLASKVHLCSMSLVRR